MQDEPIGRVSWVSGPVVRTMETHRVHMLDMVEVGEERLIGEVIGLDGDVATIQVYEDTTGLTPGAPVYSTGYPLVAELGPGLITSIYDGILRPLLVMAESTGLFIGRGLRAPSLRRDKQWEFTPKVRPGEKVSQGQIIGTVPETERIEHRIMVPPGMSGEVLSVAAPGKYTIEQEVARIRTDSGEQPLTMMQRWPVRVKRPVAGRIAPDRPLVTGQRVIDCVFPIAKGGAAAIPGGFGTGKTITQHQLAKWSDADLIVYIGCGERGNEMTEVLVEFPKLVDPRSGRPLMERTILIANTSDMPVAAREASIYTGITLAEYYRDMGYHVALMADSTSRWAEALRELSGRLEEMPAEEGFPAYLATRLAEFYERAGMVTTLGGQSGSVSVIGAVSPAGGDFSEPVTQHTSRFIGCFWALDKELASARYYPSINYINSHSSYTESVRGWWKEVGGEDHDWHALREEAVDVLRRDDKLQQIVKLVGEEALPDEQKLILDTARILQNAFLQQSAFDEVDTFAVPQKQLRMLNTILYYYHRGHDVLKKSIPIYKFQQLAVRNDINRMKSNIPNDKLEQFDAIDKAIDEQVDALLAG